MRPTQEELKNYYQTHESDRLMFRNLNEAYIERWTPFFDNEVSVFYSAQQPLKS
jgi:hypothetical protein